MTRSSDLAGDRQAPTLNYYSTPPADEAGAVEQSAGTEQSKPDRGARIIEYLTLGILFVCMGVWALVGLVFWIPLLLRTMLSFSLLLVQSVLQDRAPGRAARTLRNAVDFYRRGFIVAVEAVTRQDIEDEGPSRLDGKFLMRELAWSALVWYVILALFGIVWTPVEIFDWLDQGPVGQAIQRAADWAWDGR